MEFYPLNHEATWEDIKKFNYDNQNLGVIVHIENSNGDLLIQRRGKQSQDEKGLFEFIGGKVDSTDATFKKAIKREVREEAGDEIKLEFSDSVGILHCYKNDIHWIFVIYTAKYTSGNIKIMEPNKCSEYKFFTYEEAISSNQVTESCKYIIKNIKKLKTLEKEEIPMNLYENLLNNQAYLETVKKIEETKFITDGKWDWEHGLGHFQRVANYVKIILTQLEADKRTIELGMIAALLHDIGLSKGDKTNHEIESSNIFRNYLNESDFTEEELAIMNQAIKDHSKGNNINSLVGLALVLGDKLDVTFHRTINSSIQDDMNKEIQKIKKVEIEINEKELIIKYLTEKDFDETYLKNWNKCIVIPKKAAEYLNREYIFLINDKVIDYNYFA